MSIMGFLLYSYLMAVHFFSPVVNYSASSKRLGFSVGTMEVKHQTYRHSDGLSASSPMFIRGFPLYGYLMTISTPTSANFIARCELFRVE